MLSKQASKKQKTGKADRQERKRGKSGERREGRGRNGRGWNGRGGERKREGLGGWSASRKNNITQIAVKQDRRLTN